MTHIEFVHQYQVNFNITCGNGCPRTYGSVKCLREHMRNKHVELYNVRQKCCSPESDIAAVNDCSAYDMVEDVDVVENEVHEVVNKNISIDDILIDLQKHFALFILQVGVKHAIPSAVQREVADEVRLLLNYVTSSFNEFMLFHFKELGFNFADDDDLNELLTNKVLLDKALSVVDSESKILSYCKARLGFI